MLTRIYGYAVDCTVEGDFDLTGDRLRDQLNEQEQIVLTRANLTRLSDGSQLNLERVTLDQEELLAVEVSQHGKSPAKGGGSRRLHTVRHRRRAKLGPYSIVGSIHERPGVAPLGGMRLTRPFVVFTESRIAFQRGGSAEVREVSSLIVNGRQISYLGEATGPAEDAGSDRTPLIMLLDAI